MTLGEFQRACAEIQRWKDRALAAESDLKRARRCIRSQRASKTAAIESLQDRIHTKELRWQWVRPGLRSWLEDKAVIR